MHRATYTLIRSSVVGALCVAALALVGLSPARANVGSDRIVRPARSGWQRTDSAGAITHIHEDSDPASAVAGPVLQQAPPGSVDPPVAAARRSGRASGFTSWGILADGTAPVTDACLARWSDQHFTSSQHCAPRIGRAPPAA